MLRFLSLSRNDILAILPLYSRVLQALSVQPGRTVAVFQATLSEPVGSLRVDLVLKGLHSRAQIVCRFFAVYGKPALQNARPTIEFFGYKVHRAAVPFFSRIEHSLVRIQPRVGR